MKHFKALIILFIFYNLYSAEFVIHDVNNSDTQKSYILLPYLFSSDTMGLTTGVAGIMHGYYQPQMTMFATAFVGSIEDLGSEQARSKGAIFGISSYKPEFSKRIFINFLGSYAYYPNQRLYLNGSNESKQNIQSTTPNEATPLQTQGYNNWFKLDFHYVLPLGDNEMQALQTINLDKGITVDEKIVGGIPFITGQTILGTEFFYTKWTADKLLEDPSYKTNGARVYLEHDNTDYPSNPSRGYNFKFQYSQDFGLFNSIQSWNSLDASYSHYFDFENFSWSRQNVIALNVWSAYSPSWEQNKKLHPDNPNALIEKHQPPMWEGARLGGWNRLRAYDSNRFSDKAAFYVASEYRIIPKQNPLRSQKW
ncbi:MAG: BamA/TamA family outer membrane protein, partial [Sulfurimonas sp.]